MIARVLRSILRTGTFPLVVLDAVRISVCFAAVLLLRFDGDVPAAHWDRFFRFLPVVIVVHLVASWRFRVYEQVWRHASVDEAIRLVGAASVSLLVLVLVNSVRAPRVPISVVVFGAILALLVTGISRFQSRLRVALTRIRRRSVTNPIAVVGADATSAVLIRALQQETGPGALTPVAVLSDDRADRGRSLLGVPVVGTIDDLAAVAESHDLAYVLLALAGPSRDVVRRVSEAADAIPLPLKVVPAIDQVLSNAQVARAMRDVRIEDLLGREQVTTDLDMVRRTIAGKRVLVTGAGGSIGSEILRQVAALSPSVLIALDHDETHLFDAAATIDTPCLQVLADIRDADVIADLFRTHRPEVVFHAAAHKHVPLLEQHPCEAIRTNVVGTLNVLAAASDAGTRSLVFVSTDKAVDPSSVMGASKWIGERLVRHLAPAGARWCAVRFGNVLGSRGSVIPTFNRQIESGGPVTVTDPSMTRYFMSTQEAVQLVLQASALAAGTEIFMLEMGEPVNILELARRMIRLSGRAPDVDVPIVVTGPRPGEKMEEALAWDFETEHPTAHAAIQRLESEQVDDIQLHLAVEKLQAIAAAHDDDAAAAALLALPRQLMLLADLRDEMDAWKRAST